MRSIKFRAWIYHLNKMMPVKEIDFDDFMSSVMVEINSERHEQMFFENTDSPDCELMQSTGLKDKNGKEIYEGDIVRIDFNKAENTNIEHSPEHGRYAYEDGVIKWYQEYASFMYDGFHNFGTDYEMFGEEMTDLYEVIGNIYENKELLNHEV